MILSLCLLAINAHATYLILRIIRMVERRRDRAPDWQYLMLHGFGIYTSMHAIEFVIDLFRGIA